MGQKFFGMHESSRLNMSFNCSGAFNIIYIMRTSAQISAFGKNLLPDTRKKQTAPRVDVKACHRRSPFCHTRCKASISSTGHVDA
ncbi:hypothetical protein DKP63_03495 [Salmonella enterica subsp. enterica serovar London]|nr:hypothetical protein [Salmonella enterica subsp. enterica serovar London]